MSACDWHASSPPERSDDVLADLLSHHWGLEGQLLRLHGERDLNLRFTSASGERFLLKVAHPDTSPRRLDVENRILADLAARGEGFQVPRLVPTRSGAFRVDVVGAGPARLLTWLPGKSFDPAGADRERLERLGTAAAQLNRALANAPPELDTALPRDLPWDLRNLPNLAPLLEAVPGSVPVRRIRTTLDRFECEILPSLLELPAQIVHNDLNPDNVLFTSQVTGHAVGIIDFGDLVRAPVVCDLAVLLAYLVDEGTDPLHRVLPALGAFHQRLSLAPQAVELLPALIRGRLCQTLLIQGSRLGTERPGSRSLGATVREAAARFDALDRLDGRELARALAGACRSAAGAGREAPS